jgi:hypothetical protein
VIVAIMQPYFFPYIGYFQLLNAADVFVFYDDVKYIKNGWINRNRVLLRGNPCWLTLPLVKASSALSIRERSYHADSIDAIRQRLSECYQDAPHYTDTFDDISTLLAFDETNVAAFNINALQGIVNRLKVRTRCILSSSIDQDRTLNGQARVIDLCRKLGATRYVNAIGGVELYSTTDFQKAGIELQFLRPRTTSYRQFDRPHVPFLSIIDVMMFNSRSASAAMLGEFDLLPGHEVQAIQ